MDNISVESCRICLTELGKIPLFKEIGGIMTANLIIMITNLNMEFEENIPSSICQTCMDRIYVAHKLKNDIIASELKLRQILSDAAPDLSFIDSPNCVQEMFIKGEETNCQNAALLDMLDVAENSIENDENEMVTSTQTIIPQTNSNQNIQSDDYSTNVSNDDRVLRSRPGMRALFTNKERICKYCGKLCRSPSGLLVHMRCHSNEKAFKCDQCEKSFKTDRTLKEHKLTHLKVRPFHCTVCRKSFFKKILFKNHLAKHNMTLPQDLQMRNMTVETKKYTLEELKCKECGEQIQCISVFKQHMVKHAVKEHKCNMCDKRYKLPEALENHLKRHSKRTFDCDLCSKSFILKAAMRTHRKTIHIQTMPFECQICHVRFSSKYTLAQHMPRHSNVMYCVKCDLVLKNQTALNKHITKAHAKCTSIVSTTEARNKCSKCGRFFLKKHTCPKIKAKSA